MLEQSETGCPNGTTITVNNLFFNTPVRYKFLKKDFTETGYIEDIITRLALVNTHIAFRLINSGKTILQTNGDGNIRNVIFNIYGGDIANAILDVNYEYEGLKITGCIGKPEISRSNRLNQIFFVNNRYVKDKTLTSASEQAYKGLIPLGKFGFSILNIQISPDQIDVNVHPAKLEIRFSNEQVVFKAVYNAIKETMLKGDLISSPFKEEKKDDYISVESVKEATEEVAIKELVDDISEPMVESNVDKKPSNIIEELYMKRQNKEKEKLEKTEKPLETKVTQDTIQIADEEVPKKATIEVSADFIKREEKYLEEFNDMYKKLFGSVPKIMEEKAEEPNKVSEVKETSEKLEIEQPKEEVKDEPQVQEEPVIENMSVFERESNGEIKYKFTGVAFLTYLIIEIKNELYMLDQHAAHERIMYEKVKKNFYSETGKDCQMMLLPDIIELTHKDLETVTENYVLFEKAGFELEEFGENTIKLVGVPNFCMDLDTKQLFLDILDQIDTVNKTAKQEIEEKFIATIACKAAVKANMALKKEEVEALLEELLKLENPFSCPHGRPTAIKMTKDEIEKKFARK